VTNSKDREITIEQLERRRDDSAQVMWLAPVLTMAAQAFLLQILSRGTLGCVSRLAVLVAGVLATAGALWTLLRARSREVLYSETIASYLKDEGLPDVRPDSLRQHLPVGDKKCLRRLDQHLVHWADSDRLPPAYMIWASALVAFMVADVAVYISA
jgi:hypothetical protein